MNTTMFLWIGVVILSGVAGYFYHDRTIRNQWKKYKQRILAADEHVEAKIKEATVKGDQKLQEAEQKAKRILENADRELEKRHLKLEQMEERILKKEEKLDEKLDLIEKEKENLGAQLELERDKITKKMEQVDELYQKQKVKLSEIAKITPEEAKQELLALVEEDGKREILNFVEKFKSIKQEEAEKEGLAIISRVMPRIAMNSVGEFTISTLDIPSEDYKGKLIGREGRNVGYFEKITGVELLIDDTPLVVKLSSYDHEKRFLAAETLKKLLKDGRINPVYIEKTYTEVVKEVDNLLVEKGKEALAMLNIPMMKPDVVKMVGQFRLRYSYGQNLWIHSIEVAKLCESLATELGIDALLAKKAGLLHDIGKILATNGQSHTKIGADVLRKYGFDDAIINAAESHHYDVPMTHVISRIVAAADAISASRPGARFETKQFFIEKMAELEKLILTVEGVEKVHIMQAGREIMVFVNPGEVDDLGVEKLLKTIGVKVEDQLDYPGIIRVVGIRETKVVSYLR